jgi:hypothetical protein
MLQKRYVACHQESKGTNGEQGLAAQKGLRVLPYCHAEFQA